MLLILIFLLQIAFSFIPIDLSFTIVSDTTNWVVCPKNSAQKYAVEVINNWGGSWKANFPGAVMIWEVSGNALWNYNCTFYKYFHVAGSISSALLRVAVDDAFTAYINGIYCNCETATANFNGNGMTCDVTSFIVKGLNLLSFNCYNGQVGAALLYQLNISARVN